MVHAARWKYRTQKSRQKSPSGHHRTTLSGCIFATKARIDNRKIFFTRCLHEAIVAAIGRATDRRDRSRDRSPRRSHRVNTPLSNNISSTCPHNMVNFGPLVSEIGLPVWGTPPNFNGFRVLAALLHGSQVVGVSQTLQRCSAGRPSRWALAHILVLGLMQFLYLCLLITTLTFQPV